MQAGERGSSSSSREGTVVEQRDERTHGLRCVEEEVGARPRGIRATPRFGHASLGRAQCCCSPGSLFSYLLPPPPSPRQIPACATSLASPSGTILLTHHRTPPRTSPRSTVHGPRSTCTRREHAVNEWQPGKQPLVMRPPTAPPPPFVAVSQTPRRHRHPAIAPSRPQIARF